MHKRGRPTKGAGKEDYINAIRSLTANELQKLSTDSYSKENTVWTTLAGQLNDKNRQKLYTRWRDNYGNIRELEKQKLQEYESKKILDRSTNINNNNATDTDINISTVYLLYNEPQYIEFDLGLLRNYVNLLLLNRRDTLNYKVHSDDDDKLNHYFEFSIELICDCNLPFDDTVSACIYCDKQIHDSCIHNHQKFSCDGVKQWETVNKLTTSAINNIDNRILLEFAENLNDSGNVFEDIQYIDSPEKAQDDGEDNGYDDVSVCQGEIDTEKYIELIEPIYNPPSDNSIKYIEEKLKLIQKASNLINIHCLFSDLQNIRSTILQPLSTGLHKLIIIILFDGQHWLTTVNYKSARHFTVFDRHFTGFSRRLICMLSRAVNFTCYTHYRVELLPVKQCPIDEKTDIYFALPYAVLALKLYADKNKTDVANIEFNIQQLTDYFDNSFNKLIIDRLPFDIVSDTANVPLCKRIFYTIYLRCLCKRPIILDNPPYYSTHTCMHLNNEDSHELSSDQLETIRVLLDRSNHSHIVKFEIKLEHQFIMLEEHVELILLEKKKKIRDKEAAKENLSSPRRHLDWTYIMNRFYLIKANGYCVFAYKGHTWNKEKPSNKQNLNDVIFSTRAYCTFTECPCTLPTKITLSRDRTLKLNFSGNCTHSTSEI
ncbi:unnamed protein product [Didymodactylos carnosus]|uniref:Uncharacterized protein n=1 Tax=Didymodactylos carnosus TaxID=1234261 RepID=A0A8S2SWP6_9BILA|nr:unnamed protein product [Didymodactylos carnosus]